MFLQRIGHVLSLFLVFSQVVCAEGLGNTAFKHYAHKMPEDLVAEVKNQEQLRLIVRYEDTAIEADIQRFKISLKQDKSSNGKLAEYKAGKYGEMKSAIMPQMDPGLVKLHQDYSHLPMNVVLVKGEKGLLALVSNPKVMEVFRDTPLQHFLTQSAALVRATDTRAQTGYDGANTTVVVLDTGVNYALTDFGNCTAPGQPASCRVAVAQDFAAEDNTLDADGHGTNVSGVVAGIARGARLAVFDIFDGSSAFSSVTISGINWAIANQSTFNIKAINLSVGDASQNATQCSGGNNPFRAPIAAAYNAGIFTVIAAGNSGFSNGLANPACTPLAVSVGAVYDSNVGSISFGVCSDTVTAADRVTCFSNSASYLSLLAPGAIITAASSSFTGTSQAAPHVSAAIAILQGARPSETLPSTLSRLTTNGVSVLDSRNNLSFPRLNIFAALGSVNDNFVDSQAIINGVTNQTVTTFGAVTSNQFSSKQSGEPNHAGNVGGKSVWFQWTAPGDGLVTIDTHGSSFNTLLAVYTGSDVAALTAVAANDDDGSANGTSGLNFVVAAGTVYRIAVDGFGGASGQVSLNIQFNTNPTSTTSATVPLLPELGQWLLAFLLCLLAAGILQRKQAKIIFLKFNDVIGGFIQYRTKHINFFQQFCRLF
ncbi:MAG: hypothetical protein CTY18_04215 [Methylomonas sp.]|nr:MAG: hypothetical protein CTY18_04215 [Methylomonas sp.]